MANFTDAQNREWKVFIDIPTVKKLKERDLDILKMFDGGMEVFEKIVGDPIRLVDTLWLVCEEQIKERGLDEVGFAKSLYGDTLMGASEALVEGVCDFFPDPKRRAGIRLMLRKSKEAGEIMLDQALAEVEGLDVSKIAEAVASESTAKSGEQPDTSASTP